MIGIVVQAVPSRIAMVAEHIRLLGADAPVIVDVARAGNWPTARRSWLVAAALGRPWSMVLQDDMRPSRSFLARMTAEAHGRRAVSAFQPAHHHAPALYAAAVAGGESSVSLPHGSVAWGGTVAMPTELVAPFVAFADRHAAAWPGSTKDDDVRLTLFLGANGVPIVCLVPEELRHVGYQHSEISAIHSASGDWRRGCMYSEDSCRSV